MGGVLADDGGARVPVSEGGAEVGLLLLGSCCCSFAVRCAVARRRRSALHSRFRRAMSATGVSGKSDRSVRLVSALLRLNDSRYEKYSTVLR